MVLPASFAVKDIMRAQLKHALPADKKLLPPGKRLCPPVAPPTANLTFHENQLYRFPGAIVKPD